MIDEYGIMPEMIESITVMSFSKATLLGRTAPENPVAAMYSIPYVIGTKLIKGEVSPREMTAESLSDRRILDIAQKVTIIEDVELTSLFPEKCLAKIVVCLKDGTVIRSDTLSAKGDVDNPYSYEELRSKFLNLTKSLPNGRSEELFELIMNIENSDPRVIWEMLREA